MPRKARVKSSTRIYHVMLRGMNKQQIFYDDEDFYYFERLLKRYKEEQGFGLPAYCLMGNHVHLLIVEENYPLENVIKRIGDAFVYWYNNKYERTGHLFQDRFRSEPIETEQYFLTAFRYILNNPVKAKICQKAEDYKYSSACEYLLGKSGISDQKMVWDIFGPDGLSDFINAENNDMCLEIDESPKYRCTDDMAKKKILAAFGTYTPVITRKNRDFINASTCKVIREGVSIRQLSRLTGMSKRIIEKALK